MGRLPYYDEDRNAKRAPRAFCRKPNATGLLLPTRRRPTGYYRVLEVLPSASASEIKKAYFRLSLACHPDKATCPQQRSACTRNQQLLNEAYEVLKEPESRKLYDRKLTSLGLGILIEGNINTHKARVFRHRLSHDEKKVVSSINSARKRIDSCRLSQRLKKAPTLNRKVHSTKITTRRSRAVAPGSTWLILKRSRAERKADKRRGKFVAVLR